jgi:phosphoribosylpyrophosphate synthetase
MDSSKPLPACTCRKFADGFPDLFVEDALSIRNRHVAFLASFHNPSVIFEQISVIYALPRLFVGSFTLVLPFFPTGTLERVGLRVQSMGAARGTCQSIQLCPILAG